MKKILIIIAIALSGCSNTQVNTFEQVLKQQQPITVSTIGDSRFISFGGSVIRKAINDKVITNVSFVGSLQDDYGFNHDAVGGDNSSQLMERYNNIPQADIYVILFGTNDLWREDIAVPLQTLTFIIQDKLSEGSKVFYCKQTPRNDYKDAYHIELDQAVIKRFGNIENFTAVDTRTPLLYRNGVFNTSLYDDHVHPNNKGGEIIGQTIANQIDFQSYW